MSPRIRHKTREVRSRMETFMIHLKGQNLFPWCHSWWQIATVNAAGIRFRASRSRDFECGHKRVHGRVASHDHRRRPRISSARELLTYAWKAGRELGPLARPPAETRPQPNQPLPCGHTCCRNASRKTQLRPCRAHHPATRHQSSSLTFNSPPQRSIWVPGQS
jgi:hypothetical protein